MGEHRNERELVGMLNHLGATSGKSSGILVVEDDPDLQWRLARMLTVNGNRVVGTSSGEGALALIAQWPVDLVLVSRDLPGISGLEVADRIRAEHPHIPVVLMTPDEAAPRRRHVEDKMVRFVRKPFRFDAIAELLKALHAGTPSPEPAE